MKVPEDSLRLAANSPYAWRARQMWTNDFHAVECVPFVLGGREKFCGRRDEIMHIISVPQLVHYATACMLDQHRRRSTGNSESSFRFHRTVQKWRGLGPQQCPLKGGAPRNADPIRVPAAAWLDAHVRLHRGRVPGTTNEVKS
ncbi:uncharacterized protein LOC125942956 isoform X2 [Dermacentor silvarum]|uniref:uncharacterized protein LOC125942956 isoform X1 n=1 Tax=Dermacentor silvarum TaxID=543639 RepID=UPI0021010466|nr:uncharacterized protein LOC125942956 isoform X1 [Dermacentor silvarum]XP_049517194.1 uncharacterized protein LOC125942956 isoform X2 [Dermacentor silvarum]